MDYKVEYVDVYPIIARMKGGCEKILKRMVAFGKQESPDFAECSLVLSGKLIDEKCAQDQWVYNSMKMQLGEVKQVYSDLIALGATGYVTSLQYNRIVLPLLHKLQTNMCLNFGVVPVSLYVFENADFVKPSKTNAGTVYFNCYESLVAVAEGVFDYIVNAYACNFEVLERKIPAPMLFAVESRITKLLCDGLKRDEGMDVTDNSFCFVNSSAKSVFCKLMAYEYVMDSLIECGLYSADACDVLQEMEARFCDELSAYKVVDSAMFELEQLKELVYLSDGTPAEDLGRMVDAVFEILSVDFYRAIGGTIMKGETLNDFVERLEDEYNDEHQEDYRELEEEQEAFREMMDSVDGDVERFAELLGYSRDDAEEVEENEESSEEDDDEFGAYACMDNIFKVLQDARAKKILELKRRGVEQQGDLE